MHAHLSGRRGSGARERAGIDGNCARSRFRGIHRLRPITYDAGVPQSRLYWPSDRKLFRQRPRARLLTFTGVFGAVAALVIALGVPGWM